MARQSLDMQLSSSLEACSLALCRHALSISLFMCPWANLMLGIFGTRSESTTGLGGLLTHQEHHMGLL